MPFELGRQSSRDTANT
jgi:hypothetical protein